jgi:hypothetical protein
MKRMMTENRLVLDDFGPSEQVIDLMADRLADGPKDLATYWGRPFRLYVETALALCNHSLTFVYVDVSMRRHRVK